MTPRKAGDGLTAPSYKNKASICIDCGNGGGRCSWTQRMEPVPGSTIQNVILRMQKSGKSYYEEISKVIDCPCYYRKERRGSDGW